MRIILVRHGETEENKKGILQGQIHGTLSDIGIIQAKKLTERLRDENFDIIFSSDLARALDTAKEIKEFHKNTPFEITKELREMDIGEFSGKTKEESEILKSKLVNPVESREMLFERAKEFLKFLNQEHSDKNILLVTHGGIGNAIVCNILEISNQDYKQVEKLDNTSVSIFELNDGKFTTKLINCTEHLK